MSESENVDRRLDRLERKLDELKGLIEQRLSSEPRQRAVRGRRSASVFWGIFIVVIGIIWLGQNLGLEWLGDFHYWPVALIVFGLYFIFGK